MIEAAVLGGAFDGAYVVGVFDDADRGAVAAGVAADLPLLRLGGGEAAPAGVDAPPRLLQGLGEPYSVVLLAPDDVEGYALGAPGSDGGKLGELGDEPFYGTGVGRQRAPTFPAGSARGPPGPRCRRRASCLRVPGRSSSPRSR